MHVLCTVKCRELVQTLLVIDCVVFSTMCNCVRKFYIFVQFQFVNSFLSLFYIAFYLQDMDRLKDVSTENPYFDTAWKKLHGCNIILNRYNL